MEDARDEDNLAAYFDGSNGAVGKLKEVHFSTQNVDGVLYGCIRAELTAPFTADEEAEFKDWLEGQCSDGYGEGLEQRSIRVEDGGELVTMLRTGQVNAQMVFQEGRRHLAMYNTPYGSMAIGVNTFHLTAELDDRGGDLDIDYAIEIDHNVAGRNIFRIKVKESDSESLKQ